MSEPTTTDLAIQIATLSGKIDALTSTTAIQLEVMKNRLDDSRDDRAGIHHEIERRVTDADRDHADLWKAIGRLDQWRARAQGAGWVLAAILTAISVGSALITAVHHP